MKGFCILLLMFAVASAFVSSDEEWQTFKAKFNKIYTSGEDENRHKIFNENKIKIFEHNKRFEEEKETYKMGINKFADMYPKEMHKFKGMRSPSKENVRLGSYRNAQDITYPDIVDWRDMGCVASVQNQGQCGAAWAIAATENIESACCMKSGSLVTLSTQNLVDCIPGASCSGGTINSGFEYCVNNGGIDPVDSYYDKFGICGFDPDTAVCPCAGYENVPSGSEEDLLAAIATVGPVAAAIDASHASFQLYTSGVYYEPSCSSSVLDHAVLIIGYGTYNGQDYWFVQNSWGTGWGESGYILMARNRDNNCGIATEASYPLL